MNKPCSKSLVGLTGSSGVQTFKIQQEYNVIDINVYLLVES